MLNFKVTQRVNGIVYFEIEFVTMFSIFRFLSPHQNIIPPRITVMSIMLVCCNYESITEF